MCAIVITVLCGVVSSGMLAECSHNEAEPSRNMTTSAVVIVLQEQYSHAMLLIHAHILSTLMQIL